MLGHEHASSATSTGLPQGAEVVGGGIRVADHRAADVRSCIISTETGVGLAGSFIPIAELNYRMIGGVKAVAGHVYLPTYGGKVGSTDYAFRQTITAMPATTDS